MQRHRFCLWVLAAIAAIQIHSAYATGTEFLKLSIENGTLFGTLQMPVHMSACPVALIIPGSGPTDRDGNNPLAGKSNCLKMLSDALALRGIGSLRFDKRGIGESANAVGKEQDLRFETYIKDAILWSNRLCQDPRLSKLVIIGHSEGSLIGMIVCRKTNAAGYVSIAGPAYPASELILTQLKTMLPDILFNNAQTIVRSLTKNKQTDEVPYELYPLFRPSVQPYLVSWFKYDPLNEISKLKVPILILQGSNDIQVAPENAKLLGSANVSSEVIVIKGMNHVLKITSADPQNQLGSYNKPNLSISTDLVDTITEYVKKL